MEHHARPYGPVQIGLHWLGAALVLALFGSAWLRETVEDPAVRRVLLDSHRLIGLILMALSAIRMGVRLKADPVPPSSDLSPWQARLANWVHAGLYLMLFLQPLSGWALSSARGRAMDLFGWVTLPALVAKDADRAETLGAGHEYLSWLLLLLVGLHVAAALFHALVLKDGVLARMAPVLPLSPREPQKVEEP